MKNISVKAIILAMVLVFALDIIIGIALMAMMGSHAFNDGMTEQQMSDAIISVTSSMSFLLWSLVLGTLSTLVGGYVAARIAKKEPYMNAGVIGVLGIVLGILLAADYPLWFDILGYALVLPAALLGGHLAKPRVMMAT